MKQALPINIDDLLHKRRVESERIEYKADWNREDVLHTLCAFANDFHNLGGGYMVVGVAEENGMPILPPVGLSPEKIDNIQKELLQLEKNAITPAYHTLTEVYEIEGKSVLVLWAVAGEMRPYKCRVSLGKDKLERAYYIRRNTSTIKATGPDEAELLGLANKIPFDDRYCQSATLDDLEPHLIREFLSEVKSGLAPSAHNLSVEELGRRMNIIGGVQEALFPKNVGLLFFNSQPERFFPATQIDVVYFPDGTGGDVIEEKVFTGPLGRITQDALSYIKNRYIQETVIKHPEQAQSERFVNFPFAAVEEAVVNAIYHRSYQEREPIEIRITEEELTVLSFPGPDRSIKLSDLQQGRAVSRRYRNRRVGEFLKELDLTEGRSTGIPKILRAMKDNGSPSPIFETDDDRSFFLIRLPIHIGSGVEPTPQVETQVNNAQSVDNKAILNDMFQADPQVTPQVTPQVLEVVALLRKLGGALSKLEMMRHLKLKDDKHFRKVYLVPAMEAGLIEMTIPDKPRSRNQKYQLTQGE
ncbi:Fic family protein [Bergeriella denitrificans]|uniref:Divergent AAA domain n=1 Tax=Bergeriella denitrificans TaxID=494 RepID=A0A378UGM9_BERDE|nr:RNA-binding domain-containing protein [Bergeriella denitrificans]STZ76534.1 Divergent AAA domain [Bergeriella denitrificans]